ncbi:glucoamylase family protein [uncultured Tessaracoccus sp.]|uniref:glucoamylase family protein n=1 Tax=uncultured Tessaracoccus sp. TaxID=905023 RepID=UPI0025D86C52|nr:glucoamylase family protein [uncultured Tessaracoccus sp.]
MDETLTRRGLLTGAACAATLAALDQPQAAANPVGRGRPGGWDERLMRWARDTWRSVVAMVDASTGLITDHIDSQLIERSGYTSPTNIGGYLWSIIVARDLRIVTPGEARRRIATTLTSLERMDKHDASGMFFNWYDETNAEVLRVWPDNGAKVVPFVSSVDMGWLGAALHLVAEADPSNARRARALFSAMRWDIFHDAGWWRPGGANYGGFWMEDPGRSGTALLPPTTGEGPDLWYHVGHHYDTAVSEARMVTYLGIIRGQIPPEAYFATFRTFPPDWDWQEMAPEGAWEQHLGVPVYQGAYTYRGMMVVPGWGGSMFEELMPDLFVPESTWAPESWGRNHRLHVRAQREHGLEDAKYGYWGFSPSSDPHGGYREYGVDALGLNPDGYFSDHEKTDYRANKVSQAHGDGVVTPHAAFLAMMYEPENAIRNLQKLQRDFDCYGRGGFFDAVATKSGRVARRYLALDQSMILGSIGNVLLDGGLRRWFATKEVERALRPVVARERFNVGAKHVNRA